MEKKINDMKMLDFKYFLFLPLFALVHAIVNKGSDSCQIYQYSNYRDIYCFIYERQSSHNSKLLVIMDSCNEREFATSYVDRGNLLNLRNLNNLLCPIKPRIFEFLSDLTIESFSSTSNLSVLQNESFYGLCKVKSIDLSKNGISIIEPEAFSCTEELVDLLLRFNRIKSLPSEVFKRMLHLEHLYLDNNLIDTVYMGTFDDLVSLKELRLHNNLISYLPEGLFYQLANLKYLSLYNNRLEILSPHLLSNLTLLEILNLNSNNLRSFSNAFSNNRKLKELHVCENLELSLTNNSFVGLEELRVLLLTSCNIKHLPPGLFLETPKLSELHLAENHLQEITPETFGSLKYLESLNLASNNISHLRNESFHRNKKLKVIDLSLNKLSRITEDDFKGLSFLEYLDISSNNIQEIADHSFEQQWKLFSLNMEDNLIATLTGSFSSRSIFLNLVSLQYLFIGKNKIKHLKNIFISNQNLKELYMSENPLILESESFSGLKKLEILFLDYCNITFLPRNVFLNTPQLLELYIFNNNLNEVASDTVGTLSNLKELDISSNDVSILRDHPFKNNQNLKIVNLQKNNLSEINSGDFLGLVQLTELDISSNFIQNVGRNSFADLPNLEILKIRDNLISLFPGAHPFQNNKKLRKIDFSCNLLTDIWNMNLEQIETLEQLNASSNFITEFYIPKSLLGCKGIKIHLQSNKIKQIRLDSEDVKCEEEDTYATPKTEIYLKDNPLQCDCHVYNLHELLNGSHFLKQVNFADGFICQEPEENRGKELSELISSAFACKDIDNCPKRCSCEYKPHYNIQSVNCSNTNYYQCLPPEAPFNTSLLYINENNLATLLQLNESLWENLTEIHADGNEIKSEEFFIPKRLKFLNLKNNRLKALPQTVMKHAETVKEFKMAVSGNIFPCDCSTVTFKSWLARYLRQVVDASEVRCIFPNNSMSTVSLTTMKDFELCPQLYRFAYVAIAVVALVITVCLIFYYRHKYHILSFLYTYCHCCFTTFCRRNLDDDKCFDCFISYSSEDRDVTLAILEELEARPPHYKFCIHERNWVPGRYITNNIVLSVQNSRKTLIILSETFVKSEWFYLEFQAAYHQMLQDKKDRLIIILKGDMPNKSELDEDVKHVISWKTYLVWGERWFFEKLRYSIYEETSLTRSRKTCSLENLLNQFKKGKHKNEQNIQMNENPSLALSVRKC